jgi:undecaprenyl diphosphate synthase
MNRYHQESSGQIIPRHIALMMDGNRRWARVHHLTRTAGHRAGAENMLSIVRTCLDVGVQYFTVYIFSTENWHRPQEEVEGMMNLVDEFLDRELQTIHAWGIRLHHLGRLQGLPQNLERKVRHALELTRNNTQMTLAVALNYGGRADIVDAVRALLAKGIPADAIDEQTIAKHLSTGTMPAPDLVIRTSGEQRLSNFLLWETVESDFYTTPVFWPDFMPEHMHYLIQQYQLTRQGFICTRQPETLHMASLEHEEQTQNL